MSSFIEKAGMGDRVNGGMADGENDQEKNPCKSVQSAESVFHLLKPQVPGTKSLV